MKNRLDPYARHEIMIKITFKLALFSLIMAITALVLAI